MNTESIRATAELIRQSDAVLIGAGSGLSSAAGYNHYHHNAIFETHFHDFEEAYGIQNLFQGFYYVYSKPEQQWGFYSRYIRFMEEAPAGQPYIDLWELLREKEYFILTTNCDIQIPKVFPEERICQFQGDFRYFQCSQPCHDKLYESRSMVETMLKNMDGLEVPAEQIPRCPVCGWKMVPWVQDNTFLQGEAWKDAYQRYEDFVQKYQDKKLLLLELGVGDMTPGVIRLPFWDMVAKFPDAFLVTVNLTKTSAPEHLRGKCMTVCGDLSCFLQTLKSEYADKAENSRDETVIPAEK